jgi:hypothetical protein
MITVPAPRVTAALAGVTALLLVLGLLAILVEPVALADPWLQQLQTSYVRLFNVDREANVPTWFSSVLLLLCGGLAATIGALAAREARGRWLLMAVLFVAMSLDESAIIHEMMIKPTRALFNGSGYLYYTWIIPGAIIVAAVVAYYWKFITALPDHIRSRLMIGAGTYVFGALVVEAISGRIADQHGLGFAYEMTALLEESLEMFGAVIIISGLLAHLCTETGTFQVRLQGYGAREPAVRAATSSSLRNRR